MIAVIGELVEHLVIIIFLAVVLEMLLPYGVFRRYLRMVTGILLILVLLSPVQKIMQIAPYWEEPAFLSGFEAEADGRELALILGRGKEISEHSTGAALEEYRSRLYTFIEKELLHHDYELVSLELSVEEDPESPRFGSLEKINALVRDVAGNGEEAAESSTGVGPVIEEVIVSVSLDGDNGREEHGGSDGKADSCKDRECIEKAAQLENHLAALLELPLSKVRVDYLKE